MSKERPILFSGPMVRALRAKIKTQTRRVVKFREFQPSDTPGYDWTFRGTLRGGTSSSVWQDLRHSQLLDLCPYGKPGDRLWVRESFVTGYALTGSGYLDQYDEDGNELPRKVWYRADLEDLQWQSEDGYTMTEPPWKPSIHMPRWACRILLELTKVRVEPLQAITEEDAITEGFGPGFVAAPHPQFSDLQTTRSVGHRPLFIRLWDEINGASYPWASNPYVWALTFKQVPLSDSAFGTDILAAPRMKTT